jgi:hypothetical protein
MGARREPYTPPEELPPPAVIARQIVRDLAAAQREFTAVLRSLEGPAAEPDEASEQLTFPAA